MKVGQHVWQSTTDWSSNIGALEGYCAQLVLVFGERAALQKPEVSAYLARQHPGALVVGCSTAGEIADVNVFDGSVVATAVALEHSSIALVTADVLSAEGSYEAGQTLAQQLNRPGLKHVLVLSDGLKVNGTSLAKAFRENLPVEVAVTGGLAADGDRFSQTGVLVDAQFHDKKVVAVGFYGDRLTVGYGSLGGWDSFGPQRVVTRSAGNVLYELDGQSALDLYKQYLGEHAINLPASALLFPLSIQMASGQGSLVRTVLSIDEDAKSMTFAGDIPEGAVARLMKANTDRLVDGAAGAASGGRDRLGDRSADLAILISCVGRKLVLKQRVEEEVEAVRDVLGPGTMMTGFYSYGEICPGGAFTQCELHNQTMTITTLSES